jgi:hypothetical protein
MHNAITAVNCFYVTLIHSPVSQCSHIATESTNSYLQYHWQFSEAHIGSRYA